MSENEINTLQVVEPSALESMERAQTDVAITTAKRFPRPDLSLVKRKMLSLATLDQETAESCFYTLNRQGKVIQGASARMAEIALSSYGNIKAAARTIGNDGKTITAQAVCHDLENNVSVAVEVKRRITGKDGRTFSEDMQVVTGNAACSIALRNAVFKVIPMALIKPVYEQAKQVAVGDVKTLGQRREKAIETFAKMGVTKERVLSKLGRASIEDINLHDLEILIGTLTAIKDGDSNIDEEFPISKAVPVMTPREKAPDVEKVEEVKTDIKLDVYARFSALCEKEAVTPFDLPKALRALDRKLPKNLTDWNEVLESEVEFAIENFDKVFPHLGAQ